MKSKLSKVLSIFQSHNSLMTILFLGCLLVYFIFICYLNLSLNTGFYCTDMYSDILYSVKAWEAKSLFPEGWVFGNQFYIIATPALASLVYGIVGNPALSMAIATILMTLGIFLSYSWMTRPVFKKSHERLLGLVCLVTLVAFCGDAIYKLNGWQLFFTLCSYYACYLITAFLGFGCFLRRNEKLTVFRIIILVIALLMSFATGMQSLRQTAVMLVPMVAVECFEQAVYFYRNRKIQWQGVIITGSFLVANFMGIVAIKLLDIPHNEIISTTALLSKNEIPKAVNDSISHLVKLLTKSENYGIVLLIAVIITVISAFQIKYRKTAPSKGWGTLISLFAFSIAGVFVIDMFTKLSVRNIYYFMLYVLISLLVVYAYHHWRLGKIVTVLLVAVLMVSSLNNAVLPAVNEARDRHSNLSYEISDLLIEKGYTTIYSGWNQCEDVAIASDGAITAGFWNHPDNDVFQPVTYLCDSSIYNVDSSECVYYLYSGNKDIALQKAAEAGATMTLIAEYPDDGIWLYESSKNLMVIK